MKRIVFFCIPAAGHTNPMLPVARELVKRGNRVRFYSFDAFAGKIKASGAEYISCDSFLPAQRNLSRRHHIRQRKTMVAVQKTNCKRNGNQYV